MKLSNIFLLTYTQLEIINLPTGDQNYERIYQNDQIRRQSPNTANWKKLMIIEIHYTLRVHVMQLGNLIVLNNNLWEASLSYLQGPQYTIALTCNLQLY